MSGSMPTDRDMEKYADVEHAEIVESTCNMLADALELYEALKGHESPGSVIGIMQLLQNERNWYFNSQKDTDG